MSIFTILNTISNLFKKTRKAAPLVPPMLTAIGGPERPGMQVNVSATKIAEAISAAGIPTEAADGHKPCMTMVFMQAIVKEIFRAMHEDANIQTAFEPCSMTLWGVGANSGGPVIIQGINTNFSAGSSIMQ